MGNSPSDSGEESDRDQEHSGDAVFDKYEFGRKLGSGAFGEVWICEDRHTGEEVACKIVDQNAEGAGGNASFFTAREEAEILRELCHPHISSLFDTFDGDRFFYVVMELIEGGELFQALNDPKVNVSESDVARIAAQLLDALSYLHRRNVVHRDIKAENILLSERPEDGHITSDIKVIDFGLSAKLEGNERCPLSSEEEKQLDLVCGTPYYFAPEIWTSAQGAPQEWVQEYGSQYGPKVDVWAAGVVLYLSLMGSYPYMGNTMQELASKSCSNNHSPSYAPQLSKSTTSSYGLSPRCTEFLGALLEKDPDARVSAKEALSLPWITHKKRSLVKIPHEVRSKAFSELKRVERPPVDPRVAAERAAAFDAERRSHLGD